MKNVLITGATGNVGSEVLKSLMLLKSDLKISAGVKNEVEDKKKFSDHKIKIIRFDFQDIISFKPALADCDILFLLRPPQISDVNQFFKPLIEVAVFCSVKHIIFLSVQGVEKSSLIPHHKIEKLIVESKIPYTFLRPAYFMQNFTTTLSNDIVNNKKIFLPAGNAKFTVVDVEDIGKVAAKIITETQNHTNKKYDLTCNEKLTFKEMAEKLSEVLNTSIKYESPTLLKFFLVKRKEKIPTMLIFVMMMLHYLPRFQKEPVISNWVKKITQCDPKTFEKFIIENRSILTN